MNFFLDIYRYLYYLVRPNYAVEAHKKDEIQPQFNRFYKFLAGVLYPVKDAVDSYNEVSAKMYALANNDGTLISAQGYLNAYYGDGAGYKPIVVGSAYQTVPNLVPQTAKDTPKFILFPAQTSKTTATTVHLRPRGSINGWATIKADTAIQNDADAYSDFIADINALLMFGLNYEIIWY